MSLRKTEIDYDDVIFRKIKFNEPLKQGYEYSTVVNFGLRQFVDQRIILDSVGNRVEEEVRSYQLKKLNYILYGQFTKDLNMKLFKFMQEMDKYKCPHLGNYYIPASAMMDLQMNIREIISEDIKCPNIPTNVETVKT